jgi:DNA-binding beta-propeller fold protein YncE
MVRWILPAVFLFGAVGCFPLELDVNGKGELLVFRQEGFFLFDPATRKTTAIVGPGADTPVFARFAPNGREILAVVEEGQTGCQRFDVVSLADGTSKTVFKTGTACYARFSPDGNFLAVTRLASRESKDPANPSVTVVETVPELDIIELKTGAKKRFTAWRSHTLFRWFADSKHLLTVVVARKDESEGVYYGHLSKVDRASGTVTRIASVASGENVFLDLAPDNRKALVVAQAVGPADRAPAVKKDERGPGSVFEVDLASGAVRDLGFASEFALYSPSGKKILLSPAKQTDELTRSLVVADADGSHARPVVDYRPPCPSVVTTGREALTLPGWCGDRAVFYYHSQAVYGLAAQAPWLKIVSLDNRSEAVLQPYLDVGVIEAEARIRNKRRGPVASGRGVMILGPERDE